MVKLTTNHPASSYNIPVFIDGDGNPIDYSDGIKRLRASKGWPTKDLAEKLGVSRRTVENWEQGRMPQTVALKLMATFLQE